MRVSDSDGVAVRAAPADHIERPLHLNEYIDTNLTREDPLFHC